LKPKKLKDIKFYARRLLNEELESIKIYTIEN